MKKVTAFLLSLIICFGAVWGFYLYNKNSLLKNYTNSFALDLSENKFKNLSLQKAGIAQKNNIFIFGSSEFESSQGYLSHPNVLFPKYNLPFQVNLIGKAGYQCLVHAADFGALGDSLKGQKVVFILSPQWFYKSGILSNTFEANSSELQIYSLLFNPSLSDNTKITFAKRISYITSKGSDPSFVSARQLCDLYSRTDFLSTAARYILTPYHFINYKILSIKDVILANVYLEKFNEKQKKTSPPASSKINWDDELNNAVSEAKSKSDNNDFYMDNNSYNNFIRNNAIQKLKGSMKSNTYDTSPEYDDFELLLQICKEEGIKPMIVSIPVNGYWYDYCEFYKADRQIYYNKVHEIVNSYGFKLADFSGYEYEPYFLHDNSHLGWKGWIYVNQAIEKYYNES